MSRATVVLPVPGLPRNTQCRDGAVVGRLSLISKQRQGLSDGLWQIPQRRSASSLCPGTYGSLNMHVDVGSRGPEMPKILYALAVVLFIVWV